jgi:hypothetical protein
MRAGIILTSLKISLPVAHEGAFARPKYFCAPDLDEPPPTGASAAKFGCYLSNSAISRCRAPATFGPPQNPHF